MLHEQSSWKSLRPRLWWWYRRPALRRGSIARPIDHSHGVETWRSIKGRSCGPLCCYCIREDCDQKGLSPASLIEGSKNLEETKLQSPGYVDVAQAAAVSCDVELQHCRDLPAVSNSFSGSRKHYLRYFEITNKLTNCRRSNTKSTRTHRERRAEHRMRILGQGDDSARTNQ